jgi:DNA-binding CsgD family transcriptional regulator
LSGLVAAVATGTGAAVLVEGEQGIGKTALLRAGLAGAAAVGCQTGWAAADELSQQVPLGLIADCLRPFGWSADPGDHQASLPTPTCDPVLAAAERALGMVDRLCAAGPLVLVMEDLHWADEASVEVWRRLSAAAWQMPLLLAGSCRQVPARADVGELRQRVRAGGGPVIAVGPLPDPVVVGLVARVAGGRPGPRLTALAGGAGGNPLYASELAGALVRAGQVRVNGQMAELAGEADQAGVPGSLLAMAGERLASLSQPAGEVLRWAAVLGLAFSAADLATVTGRDPGALARAVSEARSAGLITDTPLGAGSGRAAVPSPAAATGLLAGAGDGLAFQHGLIRQALYEGMPLAVRAALHQRAAHALAAAGAPAVRVAAQIAAVPDTAQGWVRDWLVQAAATLTYQAPRLAADLLRQVLTELPEGDPRRAGPETGLITAAFLLGDYDEVERAGRRALAKAGDPDGAAEISRLMAYALLRSGRAEEGAVVTGQMLAARGLSEPHRARLEGMHATILVVLGRLDAAAATAATALDRAEQASDVFGTGFALHALSHVCYFRAEHVRRIEYIERALAITEDDPQATDLRLLLLSHLPAALRSAGRWAEALAAAERSVVIAERAGYPPRLVRAGLAVAYFDNGRWDDALAEFEQVAGLPGPGFHQVQVRGFLALIAAHRDDRVTARRHLAAVAELPLADLSARGNASSLLRARATIAERAGQPGQAVAVLRQVLDPGWADVREALSDTLPTLTRLALAVGDTATAAAAAAAAVAAADATAAAAASAGGPGAAGNAGGLGDPVAADGAADSSGTAESHGADAAARDGAAGNGTSGAQVPAIMGIAGHCRGLIEGDAGPVLAAAAYFESTARPWYSAMALEDAAVLLATRGDAAGARQAFTKALGMYAAMGAAWDARRAGSRLRALGIRTGHRPGPRSHPVAGRDSLTPTETTIARLVADGLSNPDIAGVLLLSRNTVQTHVSHILAKLAARSRAGIVSEVLRDPEAASGPGRPPEWGEPAPAASAP